MYHPNRFWDWLEEPYGRVWLTEGHGNQWLKSEQARCWFTTDGGASFLDTPYGIRWLNSPDAADFLESDQALIWATSCINNSLYVDDFHDEYTSFEAPMKAWFQSGEIGKQWYEKFCPGGNAPVLRKRRITQFGFPAVRRTVNWPHRLEWSFPLEYSFIRYKGDEKRVSKVMKNHPALNYMKYVFPKEHGQENSNSGKGKAAQRAIGEEESESRKKPKLN
ncbi:hypothetical protein F5Y15DRAFT_380982 [Xylariaceae sp. FL0016]|nr:hypothetical protein F5Y15DRAFT_380982 [Xylariaceae sp. FL0016]